MTIQICFLIFVACLTQRTIAKYQDIYRDGENKYIVDDCRWLGLQMVSEPVITECGNPPVPCPAVKMGTKARSHQHQWQVLVVEDSEECEQL